MLAFCCCTPFRRKKSKDVDDNPVPPSSTPYSSKHSTCHLTRSSPSRISAPPTKDPGVVAVNEQHGDLELDKLILDDSEDDNPSQRNKRSTLGTLETVKTRIARKMSHEKNIKRHSQSSVGNTEEDIARRAELRRLRTKRIQEELNSDQSNNVSARTSIRSTRYLSPFIDIGRPGHGPRDAIEFSVANCHDAHVAHPQPCPSYVSATGETPASIVQIRRWNSCPSSATENKALKLAQNLPRPRSVPAIALEVSLVRPQSVHCSTSKSSASTDETSPPSTDGSTAIQDGTGGHDSSSRDSQSALGIWLIAQGIHSRNSSTSRLIDDVRRKPIHRGSSVISQRLGGIDSMIKASTYPPQHTARSMNSKSSRQSLKSAQRWAIGGDTAASENVPPKRKGLYLKAPTDTDDEGVTKVSTPADHSSSVYQSTMPSYQPSPARSKSLINILTVRDLESLELSPFKWHDEASVFRNFGPSADHSSYATADEGETSLPTQGGNFSNSGREQLCLAEVPDNASCCGSESAFRDAEQKHKRPPATTSRFKEHFNEINKAKHLFLFMDKITFPLFGRPVGGSRTTDESLPRKMMPGSWSRVHSENRKISRETQESETQERTCDLQATRFKGTIGEQDLTLHCIEKAGFGVDTPCADSKPRFPSLGGPLFSPKSSINSVTGSAGGSCNTLTAYDSLQQVSKKRDVVPPLSWARYPSHTRKDRLDTRSTSGTINSKGTSGKRVISESGLQWTTDRPSTSSTESTAIRASSFPTKLAQSIRSGFTKANPQDTSSVPSGANMPYKTRKSRLSKPAPATQPPTRLFIPKRKRKACLPASDVRREPDEGSGDQSVMICEIRQPPTTPDNMPSLRKSESGQLTEIFVTPQSSFHPDAKEAV